MQLRLLYLFTVQKTHAYDVTYIQLQVGHLTKELFIVTGKKRIISTDIAGKEDSIVLLKTELQEMERKLSRLELQKKGVWK